MMTALESPPSKGRLTGTQRHEFLKFPDVDDFVLGRYYQLSGSDLRFLDGIGDMPQKLGVAVLITVMRHVGRNAMTLTVPEVVLNEVALQLDCDPALFQTYQKVWRKHSKDHTHRVKAHLGFVSFQIHHRQELLQFMHDRAHHTDMWFPLMVDLVEELRKRRILMPKITVLEGIIQEALTFARNFAFQILTMALRDPHLTKLDALLLPDPRYRKGKGTTLGWLRDLPVKASGENILKCLEKMQALRNLPIPWQAREFIAKNRMDKLTREGRTLDTYQLSDFEPMRRHAMIAVILMDVEETLTDRILEDHRKIMLGSFQRCEKEHLAKILSHKTTITESLNFTYTIGKILVAAKETGENPLPEIEGLISWEDLVRVMEASKNVTEQKMLDSMHLLRGQYRKFRKYARKMLASFEFQASSTSQDLLKALEMLAKLGKKRKLSTQVPVSFVSGRWERYVFTDTGVDPVYYELCVLNELSAALRSGDIFVEHSKKFCDFEAYLLPKDRWRASLKTFPPLVPLSFEVFWEESSKGLREELVATDRALKAGDLPEVRVENGQVIVEPLKREQELADTAENWSEVLYDMVPPIKITSLLLEVERRVKTSKVFTHLNLGNVAEDLHLLYSVILAEGTNLGLAKMAQASSRTEVKKLIWLHEWYVREDTYLAAMAELTNFQLQQPLAQHWGEGTHSSSDGQRFKTSQKAEGSGVFNGRYGREPGLTFYTHVSDQYSPFFTKVIASTDRDALHIVDGLLYHQSDLRIEEHTTDTHGFTDPVFAITHLLGFRFAPRIKGMKDHRIFTPEKMDFEVLRPSVGGRLDVELIRQNWEEILRVVTSIRAGHVTASVILAKLSSYSRKNSLYRAITELGKYYRTLFMLSWWKDPELRRRSNWNLNKGEALNKLKKILFFNNLGELRARDVTNQAKRASGLNVLVSMVSVWNTVYLQRAIAHLESEGTVIPHEILQRISPLGFEHINLTGDYVWRQEDLPPEGEFLPLRLKKTVK